ncbi:hypothetical protein O181_042978 [Austropuccinia psidii MF-1]|uniref:Uncharacterized protein n=1 Tax=Austropuccinia psidii MF-1 TaxID=1389203 RepID=A0A9Q3DM59_9BASI|nr:hypothetical protein [Austropuccinia psidii MF-1]
MPIISETVQTVLHSVQGQGFENVAKNTPRSDELLEHHEKIPLRGGNSEILQWIEPTIIQTSNQKDKVLPCQKEGGKQGRSPSSFYQQASSQPTSSRSEEQQKELEETFVVFHTILSVWINEKNDMRLKNNYK